VAIRVLIITQWFEPEPTFKGLSFAKELIKQGIDVEVVTGFPNYPFGRIYSGYKLRLIKKEVYEGVPITRVYLYPSHDSSFIRRALNYVSFAVFAFIFTCIRLKNFDVVYAYHPPLTVGITAVLLKFIRRWKVVLDIQDLWPDTLSASGIIKDGWITSIIGFISKIIYRQSDHITVLSPGFKSKLIKRGVPAKKISVINNWADESKLVLRGRKDYCLPIEGEGCFSVMFAGNMGPAQELEAVIKAFAILSTRNPKIHIFFLGGGIDMERLKRGVSNDGLRNVHFLSGVPMEEVGDYLRAADALLVHLKKDPLFEITIPSKTQAYMCIGKPIIMCVRGDAANLIRRANCGITAEPENAEDICNAIIALASMPPCDLAKLADNGRKFYLNELSLSCGVRKYCELFIAIAR
jgi:colanic acid biosynthesis glycosyl transferase WcaI